MARITDRQKEMMIALYKFEKYTIKEIIKITKIRSEQTIYRILDERNIPRRPVIGYAKKITVSFEKDVAEILEKEKDISQYINEAIRMYAGAKESR